MALFPMKRAGSSGGSLSETEGYVQNRSNARVRIGLTNFVAPVTFSNYDASKWTLNTEGGYADNKDGTTQKITITDAAGHTITGGYKQSYAKVIDSTSPAVIVSVLKTKTGNLEYTYGATVDENYSVNYTGTVDLSTSTLVLCKVRYF